MTQQEARDVIEAMACFDQIVYEVGQQLIARGAEVESGVLLLKGLKALRVVLGVADPKGQEL